MMMPIRQGLLILEPTVQQHWLQQIPEINVNLILKGA